MENNNVEIQENKEASFLLILWKNILVLILATAIGLGVGIGLALWKGETTYTVSKKVMFVAKYNEQAGNTAGNDMVLAKIYLPDAVDKIKSPLFVYDANELYKTYEAYANDENKTIINSKNITANYGDKSLIFTISYTDNSIETASNKLRAIIKSSQENLKKPEIIVAKDATITEVENRVSIRENSNRANYVLTMTFAGLVLGVAWVGLNRIFDNTVREKAEIEELTGISVIAAIRDEAKAEENKKRKKTEENL